jgi:hypothetical protein
MMRLLFISLVLMGMGVGRAEVPKLFTERAFTSASLAEAVNHYIAIGEDASLKEMQRFVADDASHSNWLFSRGYSVNERVSWVCRILYEPRGHSALRAPRFGVLKVPERTMPADKWPLYPLALSGSTYIVLAENYTPDGTPEDIKHYIEYCKRNGVFRTTPIAVPTREQALKDALALRQSKSWQSIKWVDEDGYSYPLGEQWTWGYIENQANAVADQELARKNPPPDAAVATLR